MIQDAGIAHDYGCIGPHYVRFAAVNFPPGSKEYVLWISNEKNDVRFG